MRGLSAMQLDGIAGNQRARAFLKHAVDTGLPSHAYLFTGPAGVGKTATALAFAADLLAAAGAPIGAGLHPDLWVEDSDAEQVSIDPIRRAATPPPPLAPRSQLPHAPPPPPPAFLH